PGIPNDRALLLPAVAVMLALAFPLHAAAAKKPCAKLCTGEVSTCASTAAQVQCAGTKRAAAKRCRLKTKRACQKQVLAACKSDSVPTRCTPPPTTTSTSIGSTVTTTSSSTSTTTTSSTTTTLPAFGPCLSAVAAGNLPNAASACAGEAAGAPANPVFA